MKRLTWGLLVLMTLVVFSGFLTPAWSQEVTAAIVGTVTDPSGAPIQGATVTASDTERGTVWTAQTNETGAYNLLRLPVGNYTVKVSAAGFQTAVHPAFHAGVESDSPRGRAVEGRQDQRDGRSDLRCAGVADAERTRSAR